MLSFLNVLKKILNGQRHDVNAQPIAHQTLIAD